MLKIVKVNLKTCTPIKIRGGGMLFFGEISFFRAISLINVLGIFRDTQTNIQHLRLGVQIYEITFEDRIYTFRVL